jgi:hypothetical protein
VHDTRIASWSVPTISRPAGRESIFSVALDRSGAFSVWPHGTSDWAKLAKLQAKRAALAAIPRVFIAARTFLAQEMFPNQKKR